MTMQRRSALLFSLASCALLCFSCAGEPAPSEQEASLLHEVEGQVIARVNGEAISRPELEAMMQRRGLDERAALQALIELHALSQEAGAHGAEEQLPVRIAHDRALVQRLLTLQVEASNTEDKVESSLIQRVYDDFGLEIFVPEQVTVSHVLLFVPAQPTPAQLEQVMGIAAEIRAALSP
ncbi:MAG: hypothetical protein RBU37_20890, partial [Myxococcota bacterium]|nr:hypothetical protein [Myxococcota bacterium]